MSELMSLREQAFWMAANFFDEKPDITVVIKTAERIHEYLLGINDSIDYNEIRGIGEVVEAPVLEGGTPLVWSEPIVDLEIDYAEVPWSGLTSIRSDPEMFEATIPVDEKSLVNLFAEPGLKILKVHRLKPEADVPRAQPLEEIFKKRFDQALREFHGLEDRMANPVIRNFVKGEDSDES